MNKNKIKPINNLECLSLQEYGRKYSTGHNQFTKKLLT